MADTRRTLAALQALLADNTSGDISAQDVRDFLVSVFGVAAVEEHIASNSATLAFTTAFSALHDVYEFEFVNVIPATDEQSLLMDVSTDGGSTWETTNYQYIAIANSTNDIGIGSASLFSAADSKILLFVLVDSTQGWGVTGTVKLFDPLSATVKKGMSFHLNVPLKSGATLRLYTTSGSAFWGGASPVTAVRFRFASGDIESGTIRCYGRGKLS